MIYNLNQPRIYTFEIDVTKLEKVLLNKTKSAMFANILMNLFHHFKEENI